ncbi:hypothetical protein ACIBEK_08610 [Nocardia fusca]|uniref:hypothetical protein n=1 Tax=Nocardia fusca TaxID=941183 RepID=UPI003791D4C7
MEAVVPVDTDMGPDERRKQGHISIVELFAAIRAALDAGVGVSAIARDADFSREYISRIRDGRGPKDAQP